MHANEFIAKSADILGMAIVKDTPSTSQERFWLRENGQWSESCRVTQTSWPHDVMVFDTHEAAKAYAEKHMPIPADRVGTYGFEFVRQE